MNERTLQVGDVVSALFRPDNVGIVERVYSDRDGSPLIDVRRPGRESFRGFPVKAFTPVPACAKLYGVGEQVGAQVFVRRVVSGLSGLEMWMNERPPHEVAGACICMMDRQLQPSSPWHAVADLLADESARVLGIVR